MAGIQKWQFSTRAIVAVAFLVIASISHARELSQSDLRAYAEWSVRTGRVKLPRPVLRWDDDYLNYSFSGIEDSYGLDSDDPISIPLTEQFTVLSIRKYRNTPRQQRFWQPVLRQVETEIAGMMSLINSGTLHGQELMFALDEKSQRISEIYETNLTALAKSFGRQGVLSVAECACYCVMLQTDPPGGEIKYLSAGRLSLYLFMTQQRGITDFPEPDWITVVQSDCVPLTGKNWFYVRWPNGDEASDLVTVTSENALTFTPDY